MPMGVAKGFGERPSRTGLWEERVDASLRIAPLKSS